ncbi:MAG: nucleotide-binding universal stress UspA family protein [Candidatus Aldehydirespiratoraceae bacterium]|jgi:nucleotide-binding universal stress UspA family protein
MTDSDDNLKSERSGAVVGIDGSLSSEAALAWAAERRRNFGAIRPVYAWDYSLSAWAPTPFGPGAVPPLEEMERAAEDAAAKWVAESGLSDNEDAVVRRGDPGVVLVDVASDADLLVVGTRGRGPFRANVLGSVGRHCADHSAVPVVIVPAGEMPSAQTSEVVVGIDGSEHALDALRWAVSNFGETATIVAITSWQTPIEGPIPYGVGRFDLRAFNSAAKTTVNEAADTVCQEFGLEDSAIARKVGEGDRRWILAHQATTADLLVLGQRGRTGLPHFVLGSTTTAMIHRPQCPTAVIPS